MTIEETIARERQQAKEQRSHIGTWDEEYSKKCEVYAEEHEQIAEWLEELKSYRASVFSGDMTQIMLKEEYCKAVDDYAEKLNEKCDGMIKDKWNSNVTPISWAEAYADFKDDIEDIAEQLKAGITNDRQRDPKTS